MSPFNIFKTKPQVKQEKKEEEVKKNEAQTKKASVVDIYEIKPIILKPHISEKSTALQALNKYIFEVDSKANKSEIKKAIERNYKVKVEKVNIIKSRRKSKRIGRNVSYFKARKKAIVTLKQGYKIEI